MGSVAMLSQVMVCHRLLLRPSPVFTSLSLRRDSSITSFSVRCSDNERDTDPVVVRGKVPSLSLSLSLSLSVKEKKELASYAHSLGKKLKSQQVGKSGVTDSVVTALLETLEANELLKLKIHGSCPGELEDAVKNLEEATGSVVVGQIGRTVILYRPSLTKLKAEEKKKQAQSVLMRKQLAAKQSFQDKAQGPRPSSRGHRGSSRF